MYENILWLDLFQIKSYPRSPCSGASEKCIKFIPTHVLISYYIISKAKSESEFHYKVLLMR
jgi:hypothetical protein